MALRSSDGRMDQVKLHVFCAKCGSELDLAHSIPSTVILAQYDHPIPVKPCPVCASEAKAKELAKKILIEAINMSEKIKAEGDSGNG